MRTILACAFLSICFAQDRPSAVTQKQAIEFLQLDRAAHRTALLLSVAETREQAGRAMLAQALLDEREYQKQLDDANAKIALKRKEVYYLCHAREEDWDLDDSFEWVKKK